MKKQFIYTYGLELEKPLSDKLTQEPHGVSQEFFTQLEKEAEKRKAHPYRHFSDVKTDMTLGVLSDDLGEQGLDNGFNLQESALPYTTDLTELYEKAKKDIVLVQKTLLKKHATIINMANHPLGSTDPKSYEKFVAPKGLYPYLKYRGQTHSAGIDAKAQNSPATGIHPEDAADALSVVLGTGAASIGLFANSPYSEGKDSGYKESRLTMWEKMFGSSKVPGDYRVTTFPPRRFETIAQYFTWMFGGDSSIYFVIEGAGAGEYKSLGDRVIVIKGNPSVLTYIEKDEWPAQHFHKILSGDKTHPLRVIPHISHLEAMQFAVFTSGRIRYGFNGESFPLKEFAKTIKNESKKDVEKFFAEYAKFTYIEGRDPGANFPDAELVKAGKDIARSVVIAPSALQAGLLQNLSEALAYISKYDWKMLGELRLAAIKDGLQGQVGNTTVSSFAQDVLAIAKKGLKDSEHWMLSYPQWVLKTGKNGADRAIEFVHETGKPLHAALKDLVKSREVLTNIYEN